MIFLIILLFSCTSVSADTNVSIVINGESVEFTDDYGYPFIDENSRTQVPLRTALEHFGAEVGWRAKDTVATVTYNDIFIEVPIGKDYIIVNGETIVNDTVSIIKNNRTYLPLRIVFEALGAEVGWDGIDKVVLVTIPEDVLKEGNEVGLLAVDFQARNQNNKLVNLHEFKGEKVVLSYYATW